MEVIGKIIEKPAQQSGTSKAGNNWVKQEYILEEVGVAYPHKICFSFFGDRVNQFNLEVGQTVRLSFDISSRDWMSRDGVKRWSTDILGWKAEVLPEGQVTQQPGVAAAPTAAPMASAPATPNYAGAQPVPNFSQPADDAGAPDDLPF